MANNLDHGVALDKLALHAAVVFVGGLLIYRGGRWIGMGPNAAGLASALTCLVLLNWSALLIPSWVALLLIPVGTLVAIRLESSLLPAIVVVAAVAIGGSPVVQFAQGLMDQGPSHIFEVEPISGPISHRVDDVIVVVLDEYAGIQTLKETFAHPTDGFVASLEANGMTVPDVSLSTAASTVVAVAEILDMGNLVPDEAVLSTADYRELYRRMGGDNRFVEALRGAGYHYTHLESGWEGTRCGPAVDTCVTAPWYDLTTARLWSPTILGPVLSNIPSPFTHAAVQGMTNLEDLVEGLSKNGRRDLLFAHILMPHGPFALRSDCTLKGESKNPAAEGFEERAADYRQQVGCAERLVEMLAQRVPRSTALAVLSDHGTFVSDEQELPVIDWDDAAIAARLNVFLAYRLPPECGDPDAAVTTSVMFSVLSCATEVEQGEPEPRFKMVLNRPRSGREPVLYLDHERMNAVRSRLEDS